jgi:hypothetical protein
MLIAVLDEVAASTNDSNLEINCYYNKCAGQGENKFIIAAYLHVVTNVQILSVTHKYIVVDNTHNEGNSSHSLI